MDRAHQLRISEDARASLRHVLLKAITENQRLILSEIDGNERSLSSFLKRLSDSYSIPLSTLKLSTKVLRKLGLITLVSSSSSNCRNPALTESGAAVTNIILDDEHG